MKKTGHSGTRLFVVVSNPSARLSLASRTRRLAYFFFACAKRICSAFLSTNTTGARTGGSGGAAGASALFEAEAEAGEEAEVEEAEAEVDDQPPPPPPPSSSSSAPPSPPPDPALLARRLAAVRYRQGKVGLGSAVQAAARARPAELDGGNGKN